jgi:hypothetical protein
MVNRQTIGSVPGGMPATEHPVPSVAATEFDGIRITREIIVSTSYPSSEAAPQTGEM